MVTMHIYAYMQKCTRKCRNVQGPHNKEKEIAVCSKIWFSSFWTSTSFPFSTNFCQKRRNHFNLQPSNLPSVCCFVWFWPFDVSPVFVFLAPRDAGLEKVMLTFTFPALITVTVGAKSTRSDFLCIFALVAGNEIWRPIIKLSDHRWTLLLFQVEESTFWICMTPVCVIRGIVWHGCFCRFLSKIATTRLYIVQWRHWTSGCNRDKMKFEVKGNISDKIQSPAVKKDIMSSFTKF